MLSSVAIECSPTVQRYQYDERFHRVSVSAPSNRSAIDSDVFLFINMIPGSPSMGTLPMNGGDGKGSTQSASTSSRVTLERWSSAPSLATARRADLSITPPKNA